MKPYYIRECWKDICLCKTAELCFYLIPHTSLFLKGKEAVCVCSCSQIKHFLFACMLPSITFFFLLLNKLLPSNILWLAQFLSLPLLFFLPECSIKQTHAVLFQDWYHAGLYTCRIEPLFHSYVLTGTKANRKNSLYDKEAKYAEKMLTIHISNTLFCL